MPLISERTPNGLIVEADSHRRVLLDQSQSMLEAPAK
jgi:hypothetical protein